jgi:hypothetical protein
VRETLTKMKINKLAAAVAMGYAGHTTRESQAKTWNTILGEMGFEGSIAMGSQGGWYWQGDKGRTELVKDILTEAKAAYDRCTEDMRLKIFAVAQVIRNYRRRQRDGLLENTE